MSKIAIFIILMVFEYFTKHDIIDELNRGLSSVIFIIYSTKSLIDKKWQFTVKITHIKRNS